LSLPDTRSEKILSEQIDVISWTFEAYLKSGPLASDDAKSRFQSMGAQQAWDFLHNPKASDGWSDALLAILSELTAPE
jgi:hypothetical protein